MQIKLIFTRMVLHLAQFWKQEFWNSEMSDQVSRLVSLGFHSQLGRSVFRSSALDWTEKITLFSLNEQEPTRVDGYVTCLQSSGLNFLALMWFASNQWNKIRLLPNVLTLCPGTVFSVFTLPEPFTKRVSVMSTCEPAVLLTSLLFWEF